MVPLELMDDRVLKELDIEQALRVLKGGIAGNLSGMWEEYLKGWLQEASREKKPVRRRWRFLLRFIQRMFNNGVVPEEVAWETMVFLLKGKGGVLGNRYRGGSLEVLCGGGELLDKVEFGPT